MEKQKIWKMVLLSALIGLINGFFGGGGGMIVVPVLQRFFGMSEKSAHATAIFVILPISIASGIIYITSNKNSFGQSLWTVLGVIIGGVIGALLLKKLKVKSVGYLFAGMMMISGLYMLFF